MAVIEAMVLKESWDVDRRLQVLDLVRDGLLTARDVALHESANATPFHPANAPGTFSYHHGTWSLRDQFVGRKIAGKQKWVEDRSDGIEAIRNDTLKIKVAFSNVDLACDDNHCPKPRSKKGAGAERASGADLFGGSLPHYAPSPPDGWALYYLMVDENGAAELTRPTVKGGTFMSPIERIYLSYGDDDDAALLGDDSGAATNNFDPQVVRK
jgi:hypothetical protein